MIHPLTSLTARTLALGLAFTLLATTASRAASGINDGAVFFSDKARAEASDIIGSLQKELKKEVMVETFLEIPADLTAGVDSQSKAAMTRLFDTWATSQAKAQNVNGVYILMVRHPAHLQVVVGNDTQKRAFTLENRQSLIQAMLSRLRQKQFDAALLDGVSFISSTMRAKAAGIGYASPSIPQSQQRESHDSSAATSGSSASETGSGGISSWLVPALVIGVVVWLLLRVVGALFGGRGNPGAADPNNPNGQGGGGGGFMRSAMGGLFGAAAGMWMYDQFFGHGGSSAQAADPSSSSHDSFGGASNSGTDTGFSGHDTDYSSSGDSFDGGGGWGDSGGGGGDFGGGGGDF